MRPRFLVPDLDPATTVVALPPAEAHHLRKVLRLEAGDEVAVFDGRGTEFHARVASCDREAVTVALVGRAVATPTPGVDLTLVQSVLKGEAMDEVVRDCTMVGVRAIRPVVSERTKVKEATLSKAAERWRRIALASAKQCGRAALPEIHDPVDFAAWLRLPRDGDTFLLVEPSAAADAAKVRAIAAGPVPGRAPLVVGPEGGGTAAERARAVEARCTPLSLGALTLRADAVPLAAAALLLALWDV
jgi:16S rRNA (uracil1498-N3)-methyltransferase